MLKNFVVIYDNEVETESKMCSFSFLTQIEGVCGIF